MGCYSLSFTEEFFDGTDDFGEDARGIDPTRPSDHPTSVLQAVYSLPLDTQREILIQVLGYTACVAEHLLARGGWQSQVVDLVRETDTCDGYGTLVVVWIDPDGLYKVAVHDDRR